MTALMTIQEAAERLDKEAFAAAVGFSWRSLRPVIREHGIGTHLNGRWTFDAQDVVIVKSLLKAKPCPTTSTSGLTVSIDCAGLTTESQQVTEALKLAREIRQKRCGKSRNAKSSSKSSSAKGPSRPSRNLRAIT